MFTRRSPRVNTLKPDIYVFVCYGHFVAHRRVVCGLLLQAAERGILSTL